MSTDPTELHEPGEPPLQTVLTVPTTLHGYPHHLRVPTRWNDNDVFGHLNNTVYYAVMDTTVTSWLLDSGLDLRTSPTMAVVASSGCEFEVSGAFPDVLLVGLRAARLGTTSITWEFAIVRERDGVRLATGRWVHVFLDRAGGRPTPIPAELRERVEGQLLGE